MTPTDSPQEPRQTPWVPTRLIQRWPLIALAGLAGALVALLLSQARAPEYESSAALGVSIDYGRTVPLELIVEDRVLSRVAELITSDRTLSLLTYSLQSAYGVDPAWTTAAELRRHIRLDRKLAEWELVGIANDPERASEIANAWIEVSLSELDQAMTHAWNALRLQSAAIVVACSEMAEGAPTEFFWLCLAAGPELSEDRVTELRSEISLSRGVLPSISYEPLQAAVPEPTPIVWDRGVLILAGALAGMVVGVIVGGAAPKRKSASAVEAQADGHPD